MPQETRRILITGANGFVGRHLIARLQAAESAASTALIAATHTTAADLQTEGETPLRQVHLDITDSAATGLLLAELRPTHVVHLAARASGADTDRATVFAVNVEGTRHLLDAARSLPSPPIVLLVSTGYVYGNTDAAQPAREADPLAPSGKYGAYADSKIAMEETAAEYKDIAIVSRSFAHYGPGQTPTFAVPSFARQLARIERGEQSSEIMVGNLEAQRDFLDVRDVTEAYVQLLTKGVAGQTYNIASGSPIAMQEILDRLRSLCKVPTTVQVDPNRLRPADIACSTGDAHKLQSLTGWQPQYTIDTTLGDTLAYWRTQTA